MVEALRSAILRLRAPPRQQPDVVDLTNDDEDPDRPPRSKKRLRRDFDVSWYFNDASLLIPAYAAKTHVQRACFRDYWKDAHFVKTGSKPYMMWAFSFDQSCSHALNEQCEWFRDPSVETTHVVHNASYCDPRHAHPEDAPPHASSNASSVWYLPNENLRIIRYRSDERFSMMHMKLCLLFFDHGVRVIVSTVNLHLMVRSHLNGIFVQDFPRAAKKATSNDDFKSDLIDVLSSSFDLRKNSRNVYLNPNVSKVLNEFDFRSARVDLIVSKPGSSQPGAEKYGMCKVSGVLRKSKDPILIKACDEDWPFVVQATSIGSMGRDSEKPWLTHQFLPRMGCKVDADCRVVHPTRKQVRNAPISRMMGDPRGGGIHIPIKKETLYGKTPRRRDGGTNVVDFFANRIKFAPTEVFASRLRVWDPPEWMSGRETDMPHIKTYARIKDNSVAFAIMTSHNLSMAAWGRLLKTTKELRILHFEIGVMVTAARYRRSLEFGRFDLASNSFIEEPIPRASLPRVTLVADPFEAQVSTAKLRVVHVPLPFKSDPRKYVFDVDRPWLYDEKFTASH